ncbi:hypothetical protein CISIN_1g046256mg [Citrus sinensis]|uniref:Uncharacterized protein n=1 Tax=Citrus sinensis TaxID=2711 RepID=A0A067D8Z5_CITSI|nr:hypothetical protein CISIN_1g046256mg [Citrus sinensis]
MASKLGDGETANAFGSCVTSMLHTHFSKTKPSEILSCRCQPIQLGITSVSFTLPLLSSSPYCPFFVVSISFTIHIFSVLKTRGLVLGLQKKIIFFNN